MSKDKFPFLHFDIGAWWKDSELQMLDHHHKGVWWEMILVMFESPERGVLLQQNGQQIVNSKAARLLKLSESCYEQTLKELLDSGVARQREDGAIYCHRMVRDEKERQDKIKAGLASAEAKRQQKAQHDSQQTGNRLATAPNTDTNTGNDLDPNKLEVTLPEFQKPEIVQAVKSWQAHRRSLSCQFDQGALDSMLLLYRGRVDQLADDIHHSITNGWKTLNEKQRQPSQRIFKPQEPSVRRVINNYVPPTPAEKRKLTPEQIAANKRLIEEKLGKIKGVA